MANISEKMEDMPFEKIKNNEPTKNSVGHCREYPIKITNLINPSSFYFKLENLMGTIEMDISDILKVEATKIQPMFPSGYAPNERETVMVYVQEWSQWIRAEVDEIINNTINPRFIVWCLDYGVTLNMPSLNLLPLDANLLANYPKETVFHGGLAKCVPSVKDFGFFGKHRESDWNERDKKIMQDLIWNAAEIRFLPLRWYRGDQIFGDIKLDKYDKDEGDMAKELAKNGRAEVSDEIIPTEIEEMNSMKKKRHEGYENIDCHDVMALSNPFKDVPPVERHVGDDNDIYDRILDWNKDNKTLAKIEEWKQFRDFQNTIEELKKGNYFWPRNELHRGARYRSNFSINGSSISSMMGSHLNLGTSSMMGSHLNLGTSSMMGSNSNLGTSSEMGSSSTLASEGKTPSLTVSAKSMVLKSLKSSSVASKEKAAPMKAVYMPAGAERELMEFLSIQE